MVTTDIGSPTMRAKQGFTVVMTRSLRQRSTALSRSGNQICLTFNGQIGLTAPCNSRKI